MGRRKKDALPKKVERQIEVMETLRDALAAFHGDEIDINMYREDEDLEHVKELRKTSHELKDNLVVLIQDTKNNAHSLASGNTRFASSNRVVEKFLKS